MMSKLSLLAAVVQGVVVVVDDDNSSLLQLQQKSRVKEQPLMMPVPNPIGVCSSAASLTLDQFSNNMNDASGEMRFSNVLRNDGTEGIDLVITPTTKDYVPSNAAANQ